MRNQIDPQFGDIAKGHVIEKKDQTALLAANLADLKLEDNEKDSD